MLPVLFLIAIISPFCSFLCSLWVLALMYLRYLRSKRILSLLLLLIHITLTLSIIRYKSSVKWSNPGKGVVPFLTLKCCSYWKKSFRVALSFTYFIRKKMDLALNNLQWLICHKIAYLWRLWNVRSYASSLAFFPLVH